MRSASSGTLVKSSRRFSRAACSSSPGTPPHNIADATTLVSSTQRITGNYQRAAHARYLFSNFLRRQIRVKDNSGALTARPRVPG